MCVCVCVCFAHTPRLFALGGSFDSCHSRTPPRGSWDDDWLRGMAAPGIHIGELLARVGSSMLFRSGISGW
jgi:hypothetical protein